MSRITIRGVDVSYILMNWSVGKHTIVLTPGGQGGIDEDGMPARPFGSVADALVARGYAVLRWDRVNCGSSEISISPAADWKAGSPPWSESRIHASDLALLITALNLGPCTLLGESSGARMSLLFAANYPSLCRALVIFNITAGPFAANILSQYYYTQYADVVEEGGMDMLALLKTSFYRDRVRCNEDNKAILEALSPAAFVRTMRLWGEIIESSGATSPVVGVDAESLAAITCKVIIFHNFPDDGMHTVEAARRLHEALVNADAEVYYQDIEDYMISLVPFICDKLAVKGSKI